jgi:tripartite-type tricarboxylate transporter receptor subunit TctC
MAHSKSRRLVLGAGACTLLSPFVHAQAYPSRPIELVVPYAPGGASDIIVRAMAQPLQKELGGATIVVINRPGANTAIAAAQLAKSRPDGYTLMLADVALLLNAAVKPTSPGYDADKDFQPINMVGSAPLVLFGPTSGSKNLAEFLARGKEKGINIANAGQGSLGHLAAELLRLRTSASIVSIPYKGSGLAMNETVAGQVDATFTSTASGMPLVKTDRLRALALASPTPSKDYPEIPTFDQLGIKGVYALNWWGLIGPAGLDPAVADKVAKAVQTVVALPEMRERFAALGITPSPRPAAEFASLMRSDLVQWRKVVSDANIKIE